MTRAGYVLVGGRSSRMGRDKALRLFADEPLAVHLARTVEAAAGNAVLVGDPNRHAGLRYPVIPDLYPGEGPLGGILTALRHTPADWNLLVACDMPRLTVEFLRHILDTAISAGAEITVPICDGKPEPLCAVYRRSALTGLEIAFERGIRKITAAFEGLAVSTYPVTEVSLFQNLNTPEDWARYAAG